MRDMVEIGMGRTARRTYELDDINIVPSRRTRSSKDVSTAWQLDAYRFEIPVVTHPTDALVSPEFAIEMGRLGGLGVINGEGLIGRHRDVAAKVAQVVEAAEKEPESSAAIRLLQQLHAAPLNPDLLGEAVARIRDAGVTTAVRVSPQNAPAGRVGRGAGRGLVLAGRRRAPVAAARRVPAGRVRGAAAAGAGPQRALRRSVRLAEPGRRPAPVDGQGRLLRPQGVPEGRPDRRQLSPSRGHPG